MFHVCGSTSTNIRHIGSPKTGTYFFHVLYICTVCIQSFPLHFSQDSSGYDAVGNYRHGDRRTPGQDLYVQVVACSFGDILYVVIHPDQVP
jgi:hypothetical protein